MTMHPLNNTIVLKLHHKENTGKQVTHSKALIFFIRESDVSVITFHWMFKKKKTQNTFFFF